jgi:hypothetical protein
VRRAYPATLRRRFVAAAVHGWRGGGIGLLSVRFAGAEREEPRAQVLGLIEVR